MRWPPVSCISCLVATVAASTAHAYVPPPQFPTGGSIVVPVADRGFDMVRMPAQPPLAHAQPPVLPSAAPQPALPAAPQPVAPPPKAEPIQPSQPIGRTFRLPVRVGS